MATEVNTNEQEWPANFFVTEKGEVYFSKLNIAGNTILDDTPDDPTATKFNVSTFTETYNNCYVNDYDFDDAERKLHERYEQLNYMSWHVMAPALSLQEELWKTRSEVNYFYLAQGVGNQCQQFGELTGIPYTENYWIESEGEEIAGWVMEDRGYHCVENPVYSDGSLWIKVGELKAEHETSQDLWLYLTLVGRKRVNVPSYLRYPIQITANQGISSLVLPLPSGVDLGFFAYLPNNEGAGFRPFKGKYMMRQNSGKTLQLIEFKGDEYGDLPWRIVVYPIGYPIDQASGKKYTANARQTVYRINAHGYKALYAVNRLERPNDIYENYPDTSDDGWHKEKSDEDNYVSYKQAIRWTDAALINEVGDYWVYPILRVGFR